jgi:DNA-binding CsgD family transcriptional regulator
MLNTPQTTSNGLIADGGNPDLRSESDQLLVKNMPEPCQRAMLAAQKVRRKLAHYAQEILPADFWISLSDDELCQIIDLLDVPLLRLFRPLAERIYVSRCGNEDVSTVIREERLLQLDSLIRITLMQEYLRRFSLRQSKVGRSVLQYIVEQDEAALEIVVRAATRNLKWHPDGWVDGKQEIRSLAYVALAESISPFRRSYDALHQRLKAGLDATFNRIPRSARTVIRDHLRRLKKIRATVNESWPIDQNCKSRADFPDLACEDSLRERAEEIRSHPKLSGKKRVIVEMLWRGYTQPEIAAKLGITQPAVHQHLRSIKKLVAEP